MNMILRVMVLGLSNAIIIRDDVDDSEYVTTQSEIVRLSSCLPNGSKRRQKKRRVFCYINF